MDTISLPTYEVARLPDPWPFILPYLAVKDLINLAQTCSKLRGRVEGYLWRRPRDFWGEDDADAFNAFRRWSLQVPEILQRPNSLFPSNDTLTLDLSHLGRHGIDIDVRLDWLSGVILNCTNLTSLMVSGTHFFDYQSVERAVAATEHRDAGLREWELRLLDASNCENIPVRSLDNLLRRLTRLYYLDLSRTLGFALRSADARSKPWMLDIPLSYLRILKLRACGLRDTDMIRLLPFRDSELSSPLRSLDLRDNPFGDVALKDGLFKIVAAVHRADELPPAYSEMNLRTEEFPRLNGENIFTLLESKSCALKEQGAAFTDNLHSVTINLESPTYVYSSASIPSSPSEFANVTHLYVSGSLLTIHGVAWLLENLPLHVFDCGDIRDQKGLISPNRAYQATHALPAISRCLSLRYLRISHYIVTGLTHYHDIGSDDIDGASHEEPHRAEMSLLPTSASRFGRSRPKGAQWMQSSNLQDTFTFEPAVLCIQRLVLTSVPKTSVNGRLTACLKALLCACGDIEHLSCQHQGQRSGVFAQNSATPLTVQEINLEMASETERQFDSSDDFKLVNQNDFSFFPEEKDANAGADAFKFQYTHHDADVVKSLAAFRKQERETPPKDRTPWSGKLAVVWPETNN